MDQGIHDNDLLSIQQARDLAEKAFIAFKAFAEFSQEAVDRIVHAAAVAAYTSSDVLAKLAVDETGFGKYEDKIIKNLFSSRDVYHHIKDMKTVGIIDSDEKNKIYKIADPMGVVAALTPSTNPTSTAMYKALISIKARNAIVLSPHPSATRCVAETAKIMAEAASKAGAPANLIQCMTNTTLPGTTELMKHKKTNVILATGGMGVVRAAYSSGKPAYGVGPGNVPAYVDRTANIKKAVADIVTGKVFDYGTICASEQSIVCDKPVEEQVISELKAQKCYLASDDDRKKLESVMIQPSGAINPGIVGRAATYIAQKAGVQAPEDTRAIVVFVDGVGREYPLSCEKLSPVLSFFTVNGWEEGCARCIEILKFGGMGHTLTIHCQDDAIIKEFGLKKPAYRICVNTPATLGAIGYTTSVPPAMTLGPGTFAGSITSENIGPKHLMHVKMLAYETKPVGNDPVDLSVAGFNKLPQTRADSKQPYRSSMGRYSRFDDDPIRIGKREAPGQNAPTAMPGSISDGDIERILDEFKRGKS